VFYLAGIAPWWLVTALLLPHVVISIITFIGVRRSKRLHPSLAGKISMATAWISLVGFALEPALPESFAYGIFIYLVAAISVILGIWAAKGYWSDLNIR
jgi:phosphatidylglycerophosphate synthase